MLALQEVQVQMVSLDIRVTQVPQEHQVKAVNLECQELQGKLALLVHQVPPDLRATKVPQVHLVQQASHLREFLVPWVPQDPQDRKVMMVAPALLALLVHLVPQER